jgi:hypothetical protein
MEAAKQNRSGHQDAPQSLGAGGTPPGRHRPDYWGIQS